MRTTRLLHPAVKYGALDRTRTDKNPQSECGSCANLHLSRGPNSVVGVPGIEPEPRTYLVKGCIKPRALHELYAVRIQRALCQSGRPRTGIFSLPKGVDVHLSPHSDKVLSFYLGPVVGLEPTKWPAKLLGLYQFDNYSPHWTFDLAEEKGFEPLYRYQRTP